MKTAFPYRQPPELPTFEYGCLVGLNGKEGTSNFEDTDEQLLPDTMWINVVPSSSNLKAQHKFLC